MRGPIRQVVLARLVSSSGSEAAFFVGLYGKAAYEFQSSVTGLALMSGAVGVAAIIGSVLGGAAVDRFDARRVILVAEAIVIPSTVTLGLTQNLPQLLVLAVVSFIAQSMLETAIVSMPPFLAGEAGLERANARLESANWLALVVGPAIGAFLYSLWGYTAVFVFDAATSVVAMLLVVRITMPPREAVAEAEVEQDEKRAFAEVIQGMRYALHSAPIRIVLFLTALPSIAFGMFIALEPLFFRDVLGTSIEALGYINAVFGVGLFLGSFALEKSRGRVASFRWAIVFVVASGLGSVAYSATSNWRIVILGAVTWAVPLGVSLPLNRTLAQRSTDGAYIGRVTGAMGTVESAGSLLPVVFAPALAGWLGVQAVLVASGLVAAVVAPLAWRSARRVDDGDDSVEVRTLETA